MYIFMGYAIIGSVAIVVLFIVLFCGKKILKICKRYASDSSHEVLQEDEEEETSFSQPDCQSIHMSSHGLKQE
jgi:hypothetical protein